VKIPAAASATAFKTFFMRITLQEPINLKQDFLSIDAIQGGNRMGTEHNPAFKKGMTGMLEYALYNVDDQSSFAREWSGIGVNKYQWTAGGPGT